MLWSITNISLATPAAQASLVVAVQQPLLILIIGPHTPGPAHTRLPLLLLLLLIRTLRCSCILYVIAPLLLLTQCVPCLLFLILLLILLSPVLTLAPVGPIPGRPVLIPFPCTRVLPSSQARQGCLALRCCRLRELSALCLQCLQLRLLPGFQCLVCLLQQRL